MVLYLNSMDMDFVRLLYHLTLQGKAHSDMIVEERIDAAEQRKMDGNALLQEEKLEEAMQRCKIIAYLFLFCASTYCSMKISLFFLDLNIFLVPIKLVNIIFSP